MSLLAALLVSTVLQVPVARADSGHLEDRVQFSIQWLDASGKIVQTSQAHLRAGRLPLAPPAGAVKLEIVASELVSRPVAIADAERQGVKLVRPAWVEIDAPSVPETATVTTLLEEGPRLTATKHRFDTLEATTGSRRLRLFPGRYYIVIDAGCDRPPFVSKLIQCAPGDSTVLRVAEPTSTKALRLRVSDRTGSPVRGATLQAAKGADVRDAVLCQVLARRAGTSWDDGILDAGVVESGNPRSLTVVAEQFRPATLDLATRHEADGTSTNVTLKAWPDLLVRVTRFSRPGASVSLERCADWAEETRSCPSGWKAAGTRPLSGDVAVFTRQRPGTYSVRLTQHGSSLVRVQVPEDPAGPDLVELELPFQEWLLTGRTQLPDGKPIAAWVSVVTLSRADVHTHELGRTQSRTDGRFEISLLAPAALEVSLHASSEDPPGQSAERVRRRLGKEENELVLTLDTSAISVRALDRQTGRPIGACAVQVQASRGDQELHTEILTDQEGKASLAGLKERIVKIVPQCSGYASGTGTIVEVPEGKNEYVELRLDRAGTIHVRAADAFGNPATGAALYALPAVLWDPPYATRLEALGTTGVDGLLEVPGDRYGGLPVFATGPGWAISADRLPEGTSCQEGCDLSITLHPPAAFPGLTVSTASGKPLRAEAVVFWRATIPVALQAIEEMMRLNGVDPGSLFSDDQPGNTCLIPTYLAPGDYHLQYTVRSRETGKFTHVPAGSMRLPAASPIEARAMAVP